MAISNNALRSNGDEEDRESSSGRIEQPKPSIATRLFLHTRNTSMVIFSLEYVRGGDMAPAYGLAHT